MKKAVKREEWTELSDVTINQKTLCNEMYYGMYVQTTDVNVLKYLMKKAHLKCPIEILPDLKEEK